MKTPNRGAISGHDLRTVCLVLATSLGIIPLASGQSTSDFVISSPEPIVQLVQAEQTPSANLSFTFRNISNKTILEICISAPLGPREMDCMTGFDNGAKLLAPGDTFSMNFEAASFASDGQQNSLRVNAIVYTDGSHAGEQKVLARIENRMLGVALETKRISDLLSRCTEDGITGLESVLPQIGTSSLPSSAEAAESLKGEYLPGISHLVVDTYLSSHTQGLLEGVVNARDILHREIDQEKALAESSLTGGEHHRQIALRAGKHGLSDLAQEYRLRSQTQINYLIAFLGERNAH